MSAEPDLTTPEIRKIDGGFAVVVRSTCAPSDFRRAQQEARPILDAALQGRSDLIGRRLTVWRSPESGLVDYGPGVLVAEPVEVAGGASLFALPKGRAAHVQLRGSLAGLGEAWRRLFEACAARGEAPAGLNWEIYPPEGGSPEAAASDLFALLAEPGAVKNR